MSVPSRYSFSCEGGEASVSLCDSKKELFYKQWICLVLFEILLSYFLHNVSRQDVDSKEKSR